MDEPYWTGPVEDGPPPYEVRLAAEEVFADDVWP